MAKKFRGLAARTMSLEASVTVHRWSCYVLLGLAPCLTPLRSPRPEMLSGPIQRAATYRVAEITGDTCCASLLDQTPLRLADGRWLYIGVDNVAVDSMGNVAVVGSDVAVFKKDLSSDPPLSHADSIRGLRSGYKFTNHHVDPVSDSLIGAVFHGDEAARPIPMPRQLQGRSLAAAHVAAGSRGTWHVLLVVRLGKAPSNSPNGMPDRMKELWNGIPAELWYGEFNGARWQSLERIGIAVHGDLNSTDAPDLAVDGDDVAFAYPVLSDSNECVVLLHRQGGHWRSDTLWIRVDIQRVRILKAPGRHRWLIAVSHMQIDPPAASALYLSGFDSSWTKEKLVVPAEVTRAANPTTGASTTGISSPVLLVTREGLFASWSLPASGPRVANAIIRVGRVTTAPDSERFSALTVDRDADYLFGFSAAVVHDSTIVWMIAEYGREDGVSVVMLTHGQLINLGFLPVSSRSGRHLAVVGNGELIYLTDTQALNATDPPIVTLRNHIAIACDDSSRTR